MAVNEPSVVVTVIVEEPVATPVIRPLPFTVALPVLEDDQVTVLSVAIVGKTVAISCVVAPTPTVAVVLFKFTLVTATVPDTVTAHVAMILPSAVRTVIVAEPADTAVTTPEESTVAQDALEENHVTPLLVAFAGNTVAVSSRVSPAIKLAVV